jgi:hypothetical protein
MTTSKQLEFPYEDAYSVFVPSTMSKPRQIVEFIVKAAKEPLTALEIANIYAQLTERKTSYVNVKSILNTLVERGDIWARVETDEERSTRASGRKHKGYNSTLYWGLGRTVPKRETSVLVPGCELASKRKPKIGYDAKPVAKKSKKKSSGLPKAEKVQTGDVSVLLEQLINSRTKDLQARVNELEKALTDVKKIISRF